MRLYIAGPMRGIPRFNFPAFDEAAQFLRGLGYEVVSPAEHDREVYPDIETWGGYAAGDTSLCPEFDFHAAIAWDMKAVLDCDGIVLLPGWEKSSGVAHELYVARAAGKQVFVLTEGWDGDGRRALGLAARPVIVGLMGYAQVGKDTVASILVRHARFTRIAFADALRHCLYALNPLVDTGSAILPLASVVQRDGWERAKALAADSAWGTRALLQRLGTEVGRRILGEDVWVDLTMREMRAGQRYVVPDVRFPNEARAIKDAGGTLVRVTRPGFGPVNNHVSETALDDWPADVTIANDGSISDLTVLTRRLLDPALTRGPLAA